MRRRMRQHRSRTEAVSDDVASVEHPAMPGVGFIELLGRRNVEQEVPERRLERVEREVQQVEGHDGEADGRVLYL